MEILDVTQDGQLQVRKYARRIGYQQERKATMTARLRQLERLLRQHGQRSTEDLLELQAQGQSTLRRADFLAGGDLCNFAAIQHLCQDL